MIAALLIVVALHAAPPAAAPRPEPHDFDHAVHDLRLEVSGVEVPACVRCHSLGARGRPQAPGHAACFSAGCHTMPARGAQATDARQCLACHDDARPGKGAKARRTMGSRDFGVAFAHDRHAAPSRAGGGTGCLLCHAQPASPAVAGATRAKKPAPAPAAKKAAAAAAPVTHGRCVACHVVGAATAPAPAGGAAAAAPAPLDRCDACHALLAGRFIRPTLAGSGYAVGASFSHERHAPRAQASGAGTCLPCHAAIERTSGDTLPAPDMRGCETCHDGRQAFAALDRCNRCHTGGDALPLEAAPRPFDHGAHGPHTPTATCATCHVLDAAAAPRPIGHAACNDERCHAADFRSPTPRLCPTCHVGSEPWRPLRVDVSRRLRSEFGVEFAHDRHLGGAAPRSPQACADCHTGTAGRAPGAQARLGRGHQSCAGPACHGDAGATPAGPAPRWDACAACHVPGVLPGRDARRATERWTVAGRFDHRPHAQDAAGAALACTTCHVGVQDTARIADVPTPAKASCKGCHDGAVAFKMTGHACTRCHGPAAP